MGKGTSYLRLLEGGAEQWNLERSLTEQSTSGLQPDDPFDLDLSGVNLRGRDLAETNLSDCNLVGADLRGARLVRADLARANLSGADLRGVELIGANLSLATLDGADLSDAVTGDTKFVRLDLSHCIGLRTIIHRFSSIVDIATIERTARQLSVQQEAGLDFWEFLRAEGVPPEFVKAARELG